MTEILTYTGMTISVPHEELVLGLSSLSPIDAAHAFDSGCPHHWVEQCRYKIWSSHGTDEAIPDWVPWTVDYRCEWCDRRDIIMLPEKECCCA